MQLKLQRSQREGGVISKSVIFCLDARVEFNAEEAANLKRYKMLEQVIYTSEGAKKAAEGSAAAMQKARGNRLSADSVDDMLFSAAAGIGGGLKAAALGAVSAMKLRITVNSLQKGQHIECKSLDELLGAESAVIEACKNLRVYLDTAATFDGREVLIDFSTTEMEVVATAPAAMLVAPSAAPLKKSLVSPVPQEAQANPEQPLPASDLGSFQPIAAEIERIVRAHPRGAVASLAGVVFLVWLFFFNEQQPSNPSGPPVYEAMAPDTGAPATEAATAATNQYGTLNPAGQARSYERVVDAVADQIGPDAGLGTYRWYAANGEFMDERVADDEGPPPCSQPRYDRSREVFVCP